MRTPSLLSPAPGLCPCHAGLLHPCKSHLSRTVLRSPSFPGAPSQADFSFFPSTVIAEAALLRSETNHSVIISGVPSGLPTPRPGGWATRECAQRSAPGGAHGRHLVGRPLGGPRLDGPACGGRAGRGPSPALGRHVSRREVSEGGRRSTLRGRALGAAGDQHLLPGLSTK